MGREGDGEFFQAKKNTGDFLRVKKITENILFLCFPGIFMG